MTTERNSSDGMTRRTALLAGAAGLSMAGLSGCITISRDRRRHVEERTVDASDLSSLSIHSADGDITVQEGPGDQVRIRAVKRARGDIALEELTLETSQEGDRVTVNTHVTDATLFDRGWIDLRVTVPPDLVVDHVETPDGSIVVDGLTGDSHLRTRDGDIEVGYADGDLDIRVDSGDITVTDTDGRVSATTADGDITLTSPGAVGTVEVIDGDILASVPAITPDATVRTTDGDIIVRLGDDLDARVVASTTGGDVAGAEALETLESVTETSLAGFVGDGAKTLSLEATSGDIMVR